MRSAYLRGCKLSRMGQGCKSQADSKRVLPAWRDPHGVRAMTGRRPHRTPKIRKNPHTVEGARVLQSFARHQFSQSWFSQNRRSFSAHKPFALGNITDCS